jgi:hypothetical protein
MVRVGLVSPFTDCTIQPGQGNEVEPASANGTPDAVQFLARSVIITPQEQSRPRPPLLYGCVTKRLKLTAKNDYHPSGR